MGNENNLVSCCGLDFLPDTHLVGPMKPKREIRASVRLTEEAHLLLVDIAEASGLSMKMVGSEAIHMLDRTRKAEKMYRASIEQIRSEALKSRQLAALYILLVGMGMGLLGFIVGLGIK